MTTIAYPAALPAPQIAPIESAERRSLTAAPGPRAARALQRDRLATQQLQFTFNAAESAAWKAWVDDDLTFGGAWFAAGWPLPQGMVTGVRRLLMDTERWQFLGVGNWRLTIWCEVRGRGEAPVVADPPPPPPPPRVFRACFGDADCYSGATPAEACQAAIDYQKAVQYDSNPYWGVAPLGYGTALTVTNTDEPIPIGTGSANGLGSRSVATAQGPRVIFVAWTRIS